MLLRLHKLALTLAFCRPYSIAIALISLIIAIYSLLVDKPTLEPAIVSTLWSLLLFAFLQLFQVIPPPILPHDSFFRKLSGRFKLGLYTLLAFITLLTSVLLFWMSFRLLLI